MYSAEDDKIANFQIKKVAPPTGYFWCDLVTICGISTYQGNVCTRKQRHE